MDVYVDGVRDSLLEGSGGTLLEAVVALSSRLHEDNRALLSIRVDGRSVQPEELRFGTGETPLSEIQLLEIGSESLVRLVEDSFRELDEHLPVLPQVCHKLAAVFQSDAPDEGYAPFHQLADVWHAVKIREMQLANALNVRLDDLDVDGQSVMKLTEELNACLREAEEAIKAGDSVALGDILAYELAPRAETEARIVSLLRSHIGGTGA
jgi:hypothetical protein